MDIVHILSNLSLQSHTDYEHENPRDSGRNSRSQRPWFLLGMLGVRESVERADEQPSGATSDKFGPRGQRPSGKAGERPLCETRGRRGSAGAWVRGDFEKYPSVVSLSYVYW